MPPPAGAHRLPSATSRSFPLLQTRKQAHWGLTGIVTSSRRIIYVWLHFPSWRHPVLAPSSPKPVWLMLRSIFYWWSARVCINQKTASKCWPDLCCGISRIIACADRVKPLSSGLFYVNIYGVVSPLASSCTYDDMEGHNGQMCYKATLKKAEINTRRFASGSFFPRVHTKLLSLVTSPFLLLPTLHTHTLCSFCSILRVNSGSLTIM